MQKKWVVIVLALILIATLILGGFYAFGRIRDYIAGKVIKEIVQTGEAKKYEEQIKEKVAQVSETAENVVEDVADAEETEQNRENSEPQNEIKYKSVWDEPLVQAVYSRFSASEVSTVSGMMAGGFTSEEKRYIKGLIYSRVSAGEISQLMEIYNKYY